MSITGFLLASFITILALAIIRIFWKQIVIIAFGLYAVGQLAVLSFITAIVWVAFISQSEEGWGWIWLYFFVTYSGIVVVYALVILDLIGLIINWIRDKIN